MWLVLASLLFHAYWRASYTWLFVLSLLGNFFLARLIHPDSRLGPGLRRILCTIGVVGNLSLLGWFKYSGMLETTISQLGLGTLGFSQVALPLAISFYSFQQIAFLIDTWRGRAPCYRLLSYAGYQAFFPHLIAGPIVRHDDLVRQLESPAILRPRLRASLAGLSLIAIGLFKKIVLADTAAYYVDAIFAAAGQGLSLGPGAAWLAALLFAFVIYFDFSGYSDMAIGLARLFNLRFPDNFASPYKATSIIDFWRRWHMTLSRFLRDYLYIPLGGNHGSSARRSLNLLVTMLLGGLWHGAGWTYVLWGGLHGVYLIVNHVGQSMLGRRRLAPWAGRALTFLAVCLAWVLFRAESLAQAGAIYTGLIAGHGLSPSGFVPPTEAGRFYLGGWGLAIALIVLVQVLPKSQDLLRRERPVTRLYPIERLRGPWRRLLWRPQPLWIGAGAALALVALSRMENVQSFIYFRF